MIFEWDGAKNRANLRKHGFHFADAAEMFEGIFLARPDTRDEYGEERWIGIGMTKGRVAFVAFAVESYEAIRIIFAKEGDQ